MGKFPVISIGLKGVDGRSFEFASAALRMCKILLCGEIMQMIIEEYV